jgi:phage gp36-like protein
MSVSPVYTTQDKIARRISQLGVDLLVDDDIDSVNGAIEDATTEVNGYLELLYSTDQLAGSNWVQMRCTDIAVLFLCERRNNPPPEAAVSRYERAIEQLEEYGTGARPLPDAAMLKSSAPVLSNQRVRLWPFPHVVTEPSQSTGTPAGYAQNTDPADIDPIP